MAFTAGNSAPSIKDSASAARKRLAKLKALKANPALEENRSPQQGTTSMSGSAAFKTAAQRKLKKKKATYSEMPEEDTDN